MSHDKHLRCSFCGKSKDSVRKFISGPSVYICNECIALCNEILAEDEEREVAEAITQVPTPQEIKDTLDQYVIGQEKAKKALAVAVYNHYKRINSAVAARRRRRARQVEHPAHRPHRRRQDAARADARPHPRRPVHDRRRDDAHRSGLRRRGRREHPRPAAPGRRLQRRRVRARHRLHRRDRQDRAQVGEPEHHARRVGRRRAAGAAQDPRGHRRLGPAAGRPQAPAAGIHPDQHEGHPVHLRRRVRRAREDHRGAHRPTQIGFGKTDGRGARRVQAKNPFAEVEPDDLLRFGLIPELVGRLPVAVAARGARRGLPRAHPQGAEERPHQAVREALRARGSEAHLRGSALRAVAGKALKRGTGARGLRAILEELLTDVMFDLPTREDVEEVKVTESSVLQRDGAAARDLAAAEEEGSVGGRHGKSAEKTASQLRRRWPRFTLALSTVPRRLHSPSRSPLAALASEHGPDHPELLRDRARVASPVLPLRDVVVFPYVAMPLLVGRAGVARRHRSRGGRGPACSSSSRSAAPTLRSRRRAICTASASSPGSFRRRARPNGTAHILVEGIVSRARDPLRAGVGTTCAPRSPTTPRRTTRTTASD